MSGVSSPVLHQFKMAALVTLLLLYVIADVTRAAELEIKPRGDVHRKAVGSSIVFTCEVSGDAPGAATNRAVEQYGLHWVDRNDRPITDRAGKVYIEDESATSQKLYITGIEAGDEGRYTCVASLGGVMQRRAVTLAQYQDITFEHAPRMQHPPIHTRALIDCRVIGSPSISWRYKGARITTSPGGRYEVDPKLGLYILNTTLADDGDYMCRAEVEAEGRYDERRITVNVHIPPTITRNLTASVTAVEGAAQTLHCRATGLPPPKYEFFRNGSLPLVSSERVTVDTDVGDLVFSPVRHDDTGRYTCRVHNDVGTQLSVGSLQVLVRPVIGEIRGVEETEGRPATLTCQSSGVPAPDLTFHKLTPDPITFKLGDNLEGRATVRAPRPGRLELTLQSLVPQDAGNYSCRARNDVGYHEGSALVTVHFRPVFPKTPDTLAYIWPGRTTNLTCAPLASPSPTFAWWKDARALINNDTYFSFTSTHNSTLQVRMKGSGEDWVYDKYTCKAINRLGQGDLVIELRQARAPSAPLNVSVGVVEPNKVLLRIDANTQQGGKGVGPPPAVQGRGDAELPVTGYSVEYEGRVEEFVNGNTIHLENLKPASNYVLTVRAKNEVGAGTPTQVSVRTADMRVPYSLVINSAPQGNTGHSYRLTWDKPSTGGSPITDYEFKYRKKVASGGVETRSDWTVKTVRDDPTRPALTLDLEHLDPETIYELVAKVKNELGWSNSSEVFVFQTIRATEAEQSALRASAGLAVLLALLLVLLLLLIAVDVTCCALKRRGAMALLCTRLGGAGGARGGEKSLEQGDAGSKEMLKQPLEDLNHDNETTPPNFNSAAAPQQTEASPIKDEGKALLLEEADKMDEKEEVKEGVKTPADNKTDDEKKIADVPDVTVTVNEPDPPAPD